MIDILETAAVAFCLLPVRSVEKAASLPGLGNSLNLRGPCCFHQLSLVKNSDRFPLCHGKAEEQIQSQKRDRF